MTNKNLLSEFSNGEGSVLLVAPRDQRGKTRHEEVKPLQVTMMIMMRMIMIKMRMMMRVRGILNIVPQKGRSNSILYLANVLIISELRFHLCTFISLLPATALQCNIMRKTLQKMVKKTKTIPE